MAEWSKHPTHNWRISIYTDTIISYWGGRLELEIDRKTRIWARVNRKKKISILVLSSAMGSNLRQILENVCYLEIFLSFLNDKEKKIKSKENVILEFYQQFASVSGLLLRKSEPPVQVQDTIITAWTIRHPTRNCNDPIARAELYQLSYIPPSQVEHAWRIV
ncbi:hypothetical protein F8388_002790 [Cannabis sativa]|uniref:RNA polymerase Rpb2 domain-containing protein n=1 Tax=Cannabis sativa TaxID=3483 RepID=A0A7J6EFV1_CANSA|nr:hypothetical protein F8388_002790 [Cannabis sativa]